MEFDEPVIMFVLNGFKGTIKPFGCTDESSDKGANRALEGYRTNDALSNLNISENSGS